MQPAGRIRNRRVAEWCKNGGSHGNYREICSTWRQDTRFQVRLHSQKNRHELSEVTETTFWVCLMTIRDSLDGRLSNVFRNCCEENA